MNSLRKLRLFVMFRWLNDWWLDRHLTVFENKENGYVQGGGKAVLRFKETNTFLQERDDLHRFGDTCEHDWWGPLET